MSLEQPTQPENKKYGKVETERGQDVYDVRYGRFSELVKFLGEAYDAHGGVAQDGESCWYRCMSEDYFQSDYPPYIRVNKQGEVVEALTIRNEEWSPQKNNEDE